MSTDTVTLTPEPILTSWEGLENVDRSKTVVPLGEIAFVLEDVTIAQPGVGDDTFLAINCVCPQNFAYAFADVGVRISQAAAAVANAWEDVGEIAFLNGATRTRSQFSEMASNGNHFQLEEVAIAKVYCAICPSTSLWVPVVGDTVIVNLSFGNATDNHGTSEVSMLLRMWQYDISQVNHYQPNTPILVRS